MTSHLLIQVRPRSDTQGALHLWTPDAGNRSALGEGGGPIPPAGKTDRRELQGTHPLRRVLLCVLLLLLSTVGPALAATARDTYFQAEAAYRKFRHTPAKQKYRDQWLTCIEKYQGVYRIDPNGPWAAAGMYMSGKLYRELYRRSVRPADIREAVDIFQRIVKRFPQSRYAPRALEELRSIAQREAKDQVADLIQAAEKDQPPPSGKNTAAEAPAAAVKTTPTSTGAGNSILVEGLRYWSNPNYTRIVIDANDETTFSHRLLKKDPAINKPPRLYVDLDRSRLGEDIPAIVPINDDLLSDARAGQYTPEMVRVVVDIKSFETYKIFSLKNPFRIVIDLWGSAENGRSTGASTAGTTATGPGIAPGAIAKQLALGVSRIVIDPGHGGRDFGAPGYLKGVHEKDITLQIGKRLARKIRAQLGCEVFMTRTRDQYLTLEERTAIANTKNADLFISIHTNASTNRRAFGIETYFLNLATDNDAILVAARENATSTKNISDLQAILNDLMQNAKINESSRLAVQVQESLYEHLKQKRYGQIKSKGVKQAPFYVLLGAQMPAILVETSFISNPRECRRLVDPSYQENLCDAVIKGIRAYIKETNPTALLDAPPAKG